MNFIVRSSYFLYLQKSSMYLHDTFSERRLEPVMRIKFRLRNFRRELRVALATSTSPQRCDLLSIARKKEPSVNHLVLLRAIDGARTRGLDLGKVARYQLRHYRILSAVCQRLVYITLSSNKCQQLFSYFFKKFYHIKKHPLIRYTNEL